MGIPSRGKRVCKGMEEQKGCTRLENFETVRVAGAWETQRNVEGGLGRWELLLASFIIILGISGAQFLLSIPMSAHLSEGTEALPHSPSFPSVFSNSIGVSLFRLLLQQYYTQWG